MPKLKRLIRWDGEINIQHISSKMLQELQNKGMKLKEHKNTKVQHYKVIISLISSKSKDHNKNMRRIILHISQSTQYFQQRLELPDEDLGLLNKKLMKQIQIYPNEKRNQINERKECLIKIQEKEKNFMNCSIIQIYRIILRYQKRHLIDEARLIILEKDNYRQFKFINKLNDDLEQNKNNCGRMNYKIQKDILNQIWESFMLSIWNQVIHFRIIFLTIIFIFQYIQRYGYRQK
ncbi:hypothetical protein pb186bvf_020390 [Paramecium bursaria]